MVTKELAYTRPLVLTTTTTTTTTTTITSLSHHVMSLPQPFTHSSLFLRPLLLLHPSIHPSIHASIHPSIHASIHPSIHPSFYGYYYPLFPPPFIHSPTHPLSLLRCVVCGHYSANTQLNTTIILSTTLTVRNFPKKTLYLIST